MFERCAQHADLLRRLLGRQGDPRFRAQLEDKLEQAIREARLKFEPVPGATHILAAALLGLITWWLEHNQPHSARAMAAWCCSRLWTPAMTATRPAAGPESLGLLQSA